MVAIDLIVQHVHSQLEEVSEVMLKDININTHAENLSCHLNS